MMWQILAKRTKTRMLQALQGEDNIIYGSGEQTRSFCYADDLIDGMIRLMNSRDGFTKLENTGNSNKHTMK